MAQTIELGVQLSFGNAGCPYKAEQSVQLAAAGTQVIANAAGAVGSQSRFTSLPGWFLVTPSVNCVVEYSPDAGVTYRTLIGAGDSGTFYSDGFNFRLRNTGVADLGGVASIIVPLDLI